MNYRNNLCFFPFGSLFFLSHVAYFWSVVLFMSSVSTFFPDLFLIDCLRNNNLCCFSVRQLFIYLSSHFCISDQVFCLCRLSPYLFPAFLLNRLFKKSAVIVFAVFRSTNFFLFSFSYFWSVLLFTSSVSAFFFPRCFFLDRLFKKSTLFGNSAGGGNLDGSRQATLPPTTRAP